ncbi:MAG: 3-hydroxyacyl-CoA dehydrogenase/enoyl-CoA hydratase family protein [Cyclobacteriaceae bacterium]|nr:3-hydroxyacyl-CoA dehydrogenase/enoyl-CoA hydratase family protein [Cyclobacteriaceae bacterium]
MKRIIRKVAVLGSGIMGSRIACHFANIGLNVLLLDILPEELTDGEKSKGLTLDDREVRNRIVRNAFQSAIKSNPAPLFHKSFASRVTPGNFRDDLPEVRDCDWIMEVVVENLEIKKKLYAEVEKYRRDNTLITTNTSGIPIHMLSEGRSENFIKNFCGTHFFNPPRYLRLMEIIPTVDTGEDVVSFLMEYGSLYLGKKTIICKDTPAFIANRIGIYAILKVIDSMKKLDLDIDEIDKLTGTAIGRPKSATFRTSDVVGLDTLIHVAGNLYAMLKDDEQREIFKLPGVVHELEKRKWLGEKTGQGFYKKVKDKKGNSEILTLDLKTFEYKPGKKVKFASLGAARGLETLREKFPVLFAGKDKAAMFYRDSFYGLFQYMTFRIPEIADELYKIDEAICAGFGWEMGPFETWDVLGVRKTVEEMENMGYKPAPWVYDMLDKKITRFYSVREGAQYYYDISSGAYLKIPGMEGFIILDTLREEKVIWKNSGASVFDLGDGILNIEFHSKMNTLGSEVIEGINHGISLAETEFQGVVIGNQGQHFSAGANLGVLFMYAIEQEYEEIEQIVRQFQDTMMRARYSGVPVVVATHGLTLGGGCELTLHADEVQALAETYIGLVEAGIGVIPAGGGTKEMARRISMDYEEGDIELNALQNTFLNIATGKVATSAREAFDMRILRQKDHITLQRDRLISDAKMAALRLAESGYIMPDPEEKIRVPGQTGMALFLAGIHGMLMANYITEHDARIARKIAHVICGGDLSYPMEVKKEYLLELEREAFLSLLTERKTLERIEAILQGKKPLRN